MLKKPPPGMEGELSKGSRDPYFATHCRRGRTKCTAQTWQITTIYSVHFGAKEVFPSSGSYLILITSNK